MKRTVAIILGIGLCARVAHAYTAAESQYCGPEARRLCTKAQILSAMFGYYGGIEQCFREHRRQISRQCLNAMREGHGK